MPSNGKSQFERITSKQDNHPVNEDFETVDDLDAHPLEWNGKEIDPMNVLLMSIPLEFFIIEIKKMVKTYGLIHMLDFVWTGRMRNIILRNVSYTLVGDVINDIIYYHGFTEIISILSYHEKFCEIISCVSKDYLVHQIESLHPQHFDDFITMELNDNAVCIIKNLTSEALATQYTDIIDDRLRW